MCGRVLRGASNARTVAKTQNLGIFSSLLVSILKVLFVHEWMAFCQIIAALRCTISVFISLHTSQYQVVKPGQVLAPKAQAKKSIYSIISTIRWRKLRQSKVTLGGLPGFHEIRMYSRNFH